MIVLKAGRGTNARRLACARLATAASDEAVFDAAIARVGAIRCDTLEEFVTTLEVFNTGKIRVRDVWRCSEPVWALHC